MRRQIDGRFLPRFIDIELEGSRFQGHPRYRRREFIVFSRPPFPENQLSGQSSQLLVGVTDPDIEGRGTTNFEVKVRQVNPIGIPDRPDLLASPHLPPYRDGHRIEVAVKRLYDLPIRQFVQEDDDIAPSIRGPARIDHLAVGDRIDWIAHVRVPSADSVDIVTEVSIRQEGLSIVSERSVGRTHRLVEADRFRGQHELPRRGHDKGRIKNRLRGGGNEPKTRLGRRIPIFPGRIDTLFQNEKEDQRHGRDENENGKNEPMPLGKVGLPIEIEGLFHGERIEYRVEFFATPDLD